MSVVTLSASYGAGGSQVGPCLAERLGVAFLDRVIPTAVAERLAVPLDDALAHDDAVRSVLEGVDRETAERHMRETDRAREAYGQQFYGVDARDATLYHLVIDSTALPLDGCVELIALAAAVRSGRGA